MKRHDAMQNSVEERFVPSERKPPGRRIWSISPSVERPSALLVFLDGELYLERVSALEVVRDLVGQRRIPPVASVFVSHDGPAARHSDFICDGGYARFLGEDLLPFVGGSVASDRVVLLGLSLSGLAAAHAALTTGRFRAAICRSPSLWWNEERLAASLPEAKGDAAALWISVGDLETECGVSHPPSGMRQETSQRDSCGRGVDAFRAAGYAVSYRVFHGGHDPECWREDLALALPWAMST
jgi:enterochelin esterase family protein